MLRDRRVLDETLSPGEHLVLARYAAALRAQFGAALARLAVFGSRARGDSGPESDIDLLVLLRVPLAEEAAVTDRAWELLARVRHETPTDDFVPVAPIVLACERFDELQRRERRFARDVEAEGIDL